ncbi:MAG: ribonuclease Y [Candidatus Nitrohelix vancouverensis]|uniref:Ribonuclease Y n=1 Tax=Candidatus Nitrohelix vancouverensis TaxID=2705534 RepID=A0A7T0G4T3_9BACT|nr:MAG: ribonuclease Y [Candidatus Nitrohelix vancouverensis]
MHLFTTIHVNLSTLLIGMFFALVGGYAIGYILRKMLVESKIKNSEEQGRKIIMEAEREAENRSKTAAIEAREKRLAAKAEMENELKQKREEIRDLENEFRKKEDGLRASVQKTTELEKVYKEKLQRLEGEEKRLVEEKQRYLDLAEEEIRRLETISSITAEQAREEIRRKVVDEARLEAAKEVKKIEEKARRGAEDEARRLITESIQRLASDHVAETSVAVVELPNDDIKGRIIGREGRNIRALEQATGMDLIIDDTPGAVVLSGFNPVRREIARRALEKLTQDGRIHPGRIEEVVNKCKKEVNQQILEAGEQAVIDLELDNIHPDMVKLLGRLKYRTSYTQNVLEHVKEVAWICGGIAAELGLDVKLAKRAGLLHDIGKAVDQQEDGTHTQLGIEIARRYNEHEYVINSIASHHEDEEPTSLYAVLVSAGDTISASRPGARREMLETYVKRMSKLEEIGDSFKGVEKTYAIQAGREVRIIVLPDGVDDTGADMLAKDVARRIEKEVTYPGEIKVTVVRETRYSQVAR